METRCAVVPPEACTATTLRYADVKPAFDTHCVSCHDGATPTGPWPLKTWQDIADWQSLVRDDLANCSMPPADAGTVMTLAEKQQILEWLRCGAPR